MRRGWWIVLLIAGCRGEAVESASEDSSTPETPADTATETSSDVAVDSGFDGPSVDTSIDSSVDAPAVETGDVGGETGDSAPPITSDPECGSVRGGPMVYLGSGPNFCIDAREVSRAEYAAFVAAGDKKPQPTYCDWNTSYAALSSFLGDTHPISGVDWCDAHEYCAWAGKTLCGHPDSTKVSTMDTFAESQWTQVCVNGASMTTWATGATEPALGVCVIGQDATTPSPVASHAGCRGVAAPISRVFDMMGNVAEWDHSGCGWNFKAGSTATERLSMQCGVRGGHHGNSMSDGKCITGTSRPIDVRDAHIGFRCCKYL